jgi:hypothetical protein
MWSKNSGLSQFAVLQEVRLQGNRTDKSNTYY